MISYATPLTGEDASRPIPYENKGFPYNEILDPRRYEELVYHLYRNEIGLGEFETFDNICLLSGVKDQGRDCILVRDGKNFGLIQCKRYQRDLSIEDVGLELTKFALCYLKENELIHDLDDFTYFIASSKGFGNTCISFLNAFTEDITERPELEKWINKLVQHPTLQLFSFEPMRDRVLAVLTKLKIRMIRSSDMDRLLVDEKNYQVVNLFFKVRTIVDGDGIARLERKLDYVLNKKRTLGEISNQLKLGSTTIIAEKNYFDGIADSHIQRKETQEIIDWILQPAEKTTSGMEKNICLLAANAGMGKTVIMKDVYEHFVQSDYAVLAIKADKIYASNLLELQEKIGLASELNMFFEECLQHFPKLVILLDQIDALSQSMSANRDFLNTYTQLISFYKGRENVRIVVSVRIFDLYYDPGLRVYKDLKKIIVQPLSSEELLRQLNKIGLSDKNVSDSLLELLSIPNNLDVFSRIHRTGHSFSGINTLQDLYGELYRLKILRPAPTTVDERKLVLVLSKIVETMYQDQQITISEILFDDYLVELDYLKSERILKIEDRKIQFFHQTFYDYLYARSFITKGWSIMRFIKNADQSIMIRSGLKMILNFTRDTDRLLYEKYLSSILKHTSLHFHIKHLVVSMICTEKNPAQIEKRLFMDIIVKDYDLLMVFCEHLFAREWLLFLLDRGILEVMAHNEPMKVKYSFDGFLGKMVLSRAKRKERLKDLLDVMARMLKRNLTDNEKEILDFCDRITDTGTVKWLLFNTKNWNNKVAVQLFEKCFPITDTDQHGFYMVLEKIAEVDPMYVFEIIKDQLTIKDRNRKKPLRKYGDKRLLNVLLTGIPDVFLDHLTKVIIAEGKYLPENDGPILRVHNVSRILEKNINSYDTDNIYKLLAKGLRQQAENRSVYFDNFLVKYIHFGFDSILRLIIYALIDSEKHYKAEILVLFRHLKNGGALNSHDDINEGNRRLIGNLLKHINAVEFEALAKDILDIPVVRELNYRQKKLVREAYYPTLVGRTMYLYLNIIPADLRDGYSQMHKVYGELSRKFGPIQDELNYLGPARGPISQSGYEAMGVKGWVGSFMKYNTIDQRKEHHLGTQFDHAEHYEKTIKDKVDKYLPLMIETIYNDKISLIYTIKSLFALQDAELLTTDHLKHVIGRRPEKMDLYYLLDICGSRIRGVDVDQEILSFVISKSVAPPRQSKDDPFYRNQLDVQERAINALMHVKDGALSSEVFVHLEKAMTESEERIIKFILRQAAYLLALDRARTVELFVNHVSRLQTAKQINSITWSLSYLVNQDFQKFIPLFEHIIQLEDLSTELINNTITILMSSWYFGFANSEQLFWRFFHLSAEAKSGALSIAFEHFYRDEKVHPASVSVLFNAINDDSKKVKNRFKVKFLHIEHIRFEDLEAWLFDYVQSPSFRISDYFIEYLTLNSNQYPKECIEIFEIAIKNRFAFDDDRDEPRSNESITKFIVGAFNALPSTEVKYKRKLLKSFDRTLRDYKYRRDAENILEKLL